MSISPCPVTTLWYWPFWPFWPFLMYSEPVICIICVSRSWCVRKTKQTQISGFTYATTYFMLPSKWGRDPSWSPGVCLQLWFRKLLQNSYQLWRCHCRGRMFCSQKNKISPKNLCPVQIPGMIRWNLLAAWSFKAWLNGLTSSEVLGWGAPLTTSAWVSSPYSDVCWSSNVIYLVR